jgi:hypothetical protein
MRLSQKVEVRQKRQSSRLSFLRRRLRTEGSFSCGIHPQVEGAKAPPGAAGSTVVEYRCAVSRAGVAACGGRAAYAAHNLGVGCRSGSPNLAKIGMKKIGVRNRNYLLKGSEKIAVLPGSS